MNGLWLVSYIALWVLVILLSVIVLGLARQLGVIHIRLGPEDNLVNTREGLSIGIIAPNFSAVDIVHDKEITLADLKGRSSIFVFISPNCQPCQELMPHLVSFHKHRYAEINLILFSQSDSQAGLELVKEQKLNIPLISDSEGSLLKLYQVRATPFAYRLDSNGIIQRRGIVNNREGLDELLNDSSQDEVIVDLPSDES
ncbi:MAG: redoxin domain-containing protein [Chloroflexi bacterium]|nr:redoxin domain-containing protein [Chloroflexota bacterium]